MAIKPQFAVVPKPAKATDHRKRVIMLRGQLERTALRYIEAGATQRERKERLREISDLSGIPRVLLEIKVGGKLCTIR